MFPLLAKELIEQSARRRTYLLRVVAGLVVLVVGWIALSDLMIRDEMESGQALNLLGKGGEVFRILVGSQCLLLLLLMPALMAGSIAHEKETGTLELLLMTRMGPWDLLIQKLASRCLTVGSLVLAGLPMLAITYALGGVTVVMLVTGLASLLTALLLSASLSLLASTWCRTTMGALFLGYGLLVAWIGLGSMAVGAAIGAVMVRPSALVALVNGLGMVVPGLTLFIETTPSPSTFHDLSDDSWIAVLDPVIQAVEGVWIPIMGGLLALVLARLLLIRRAGVSGPNLVMRVFRRFDRLAEDGDAALGFSRPVRDLPTTDPVGWRMLRGRSLASWRYLIRILLPTFAAASALLIITAPLSGSDPAKSMVPVWYLVLIAMVLLTSLFASVLFISERTSQTLDVLLTTPLTPRDLLRGKAKGLRRLHAAGLLLLGPMLALIWVAGAVDHAGQLADSACPGDVGGSGGRPALPQPDDRHRMDPDHSDRVVGWWRGDGAHRHEYLYHEPL